LIITTFVVTAGVAGCSGGHKSTRVAPSSASTARSVGSTTTSSAASSTTTSIGSPHTPPLQAMSATFVSTQRAWVLKADATQCDSGGACASRVYGTADGGAHWAALGAISAATLPTIRFADATHGFAFDDAQVFATDDGGRHWRLLKTPFSRVQTLEIARGVVYVIARTPVSSVQNAFRIWSTPADRSDWSVDPLGVPIGAGPVPRQQFVFAGSDGFLLNSDRTVLGGARLLPTHRWATWTPPCLDIAGPEYLAMSSATDLVALCDEGVWSGPKITPAAYFSHDGGVTWSRRVAPTYGLLGSPNASTAVIAIAQTLWRTTNSGMTWLAVSGPHETEGTGAVELGFTSPTHAYAILGDHELVITRDGGETWAPFGP
jgi:BNR/Asp-box repeat